MGFKEIPMECGTYERCDIKMEYIFWFFLLIFKVFNQKHYSLAAKQISNPYIKKNYRKVGSSQLLTNTWKI